MVSARDARLHINREPEQTLPECPTKNGSWLGAPRRTPVSNPGLEGMADAVVFVVDDDLSVRQGLHALLESAGLRVRSFERAAEFLQQPLPTGPSCLILDLDLPGVSGMELQRQLATTNRTVPIIFVTGHGDIPTTVRAMKAGAVEFLTKPFRDDELLAA